MLPARILAFLRFKEDRDRARKQRFPGFVTVKGLVGLFETQMRVPTDICLTCIEELVLRGLVEPYDPSCSPAGSVAPGIRIKIRPKGRLHLDWALRERTYVRMMLEVDPLVHREIAEDLRKLKDHFLDLLRQPPSAEIPESEKKMVATYIGYVLHWSGRVSPIGVSEALTPLRQLEDALRGAWLGGN